MSKVDSRKGSSDGEDIPSDFFDGFCEEDFLEVIDNWNDEIKDSRVPIGQEAVKNAGNFRKGNYSSKRKQDKDYHMIEEKRLNDYIRPGSRRDPNKTNQAIKKDKEVKVKELLAKHLESTDDIRPPGTELDDYFDESRNSEKKKFVDEITKKHINEKSSTSPYKDMEERRQLTSPRIRHVSPLRKRRISPSRHRRDTPVKFRRGSPKYRRESPPPFRHEYSPKQREGYRGRGRGFIRFSPTYRSRRPHVTRRSPHRSPHRSPYRSPKRYRSPDSKRERRSRSYYRRYRSRSKSRSSRRGISKDCDDKYVHPTSHRAAPVNNFVAPFQRSQDTFAYTQPYFEPKVVPQPVPAPVKPVPSPNVVPTSFQIPSGSLQYQDTNVASQCDALAKLVADGNLSHEDYLKLAPTKGATSKMDPKDRVAVLNRCRIAMDNLSKLGLPHHLIISANVVSLVPKDTAPKFCSPLKRQTAVEFHFTKNNKSSVEQRNKEIIDSIISSLSLEKIISRSQRRTKKPMKDASCQTMLPVCDVCDIRESTKFSDMSTSIDPEHFSSTVHTQVIEEDLYSSKTLFNPSGSSSSGAPISLVHLTPAQLVSQLAARAKTLKHTEKSQSNPNSSLDNYNRLGNPYQNSNFNNYRY